MVLESSAATPREKKKKVLRVSTHTPLPPPALRSLQHPSTSNSRHQQRALTTNHDTRAHTHTVLTRSWRVIRGVLGSVLHIFDHSFSRFSPPPPLSLPVSLPLPLSPMPTVVPVLLHSQLRTTSGRQPYRVHRVFP